MSKNEDGLDHIRIPFEKLKFGNKLEVQGYGTIYEGEFDDQKVALKRLNITNLANIKQKLLDEILTISEFRHHPNLVALLGFCDEKSNEIILVYEFVGSGNLADKMRKRLNTIQRLEICLGAARGLEYLHTGVDFCKSGIVHGHIKPSKILLNSNNSKFEAKVSSFGLSKIVPGQASIKSIDDIEKPTKEADVYDFGVLLLEVLCGVSELVDTDDYHEKHVTELVPKRLEQDKVRKVVHFDIRKEFKTEALETYAKIACRCVVENVEARPSMGQVVEELEKTLRLQGGEVSYVEICGSKKITDAQEEIVVEEYPNDVNNNVPVNSNVDDVNSPIIEKNMNGLITNDKLGNEINIVDATSDLTNGEKNTSEDVTTEERNSVVSHLDSVDGESVSDEIKTEDAQKESCNNDPKTTEGHIDDSSTNENRIIIEDAQTESGNTDLETTEEIIDDLNLNEKSNIGVENEDENQTITHIEDVQKESSNNEPEITEDGLNDSNSNEKTNIIDENEDDKLSRSINIEDAQKESSNNEPETTEEIIDDSNSNEKSNIIENEDDNQDKTHIEDVQKEITKNEPETAEEIIDDSRLNEKSNVADVNEDNNQNITQTDAPQEERINNELTTTEEIIDELNLNEKSNIAVKIEDDNQNIKQTEDDQEESIKNKPETTEDIMDNSNSNIAVKNEDDNQKVTLMADAEKMSSDIADEEPKPEETVDEDIAEKEIEPKIESIEKTVDEIATIEQSSDVPILGGEDSESVPEGENNKYITIDQKSNDEPKITGEDEIDRDSKIVTSSESNDDLKEKGNDGPDNNEIMDDKHTTIEITMVQEVQEPPFLDSDNTNAEKHKRLLNTGKKPEMIVNIRDGDFSDFATKNNLQSAEKTKEAESKRSNSTCSESSNGDISTPSDYLLPKSPANGTTIVKKTSDTSRNCCSCSWWRYISNRIVFYGGQFWNKLVGCFGWIGGQCSSKRD